MSRPPNRPPSRPPVVQLARTAAVPASVLASVRALMDAAFAGDFGADDWEHALGGEHAWVADLDGEMVAHGALVPRTLWVGDEPLDVGYVEAVAVRPDRQRRGLGSGVMAALERRTPAYDLLALSASDSGLPFYRSRGWVVWRGPTGVRCPDGDQPTPGDTGSVLVRGSSRPLATLDLDAPLWCDPRPGDPW